MLYPILTYSRDLGDFTHNLVELHASGLKAIRLIYKGKSETDFNARIEEIQQLISENKLELDILIDLPGKKPIVGHLNEGLHVELGFEYQLTNEKTASSSSSIPIANFFDHECFNELLSGDIISIADDELNLLVTEVTDEVIETTALNSFHLTSNRSMGLKNKDFTIEANSEADLSFVQNLKVIPRNMKLVVSFTKTANDLKKLKQLQPEIELIPKIETIVSDADLLEIIKHCETLMLGRGDLSLVCTPKELFSYQEHLIELCRQHNKKLIIGTGLLSSISDKQSTTIAEVMDYAHLRNRGIDGFLLAGSNAQKYPFETLEFMRNYSNNNLIVV